jgi:two-component SAPR family response regulator
MTAALEGVRVLVVEDEYLVAILIEEILESAGCIVRGPIPRLPDALDAVDHDDFDAAVLDVNLAGERIDPVAQALSRRKVPFVFVTGYGEGVLSEEFAERPRLCKPFRMADLLGAVLKIVKPPIRYAAQPG